MTSNTSNCAIWTGFQTTRDVNVAPRLRLLDSDRAGGAYRIPRDAELTVRQWNDSQKALLTTWLINQRLQGESEPLVTREVLAYVEAASPLPVHERADRLLRFIASQTGTVGTEVVIRSHTTGAYAWSESFDWNDVLYFLRYIEQMGWITGRQGVTMAGFIGVVTIRGYAHISDLRTASTSVQGFVAMWIDDSTDDAFRQGIEPAIQDAGYKPLRIDQKPDVVKIDDEIVAEIRRSRFLVADFTQHEREARGGVYFEAGLAMGLGIPVIFTCRKDVVDANNLHFDTRQYAHIVWETPAELRLDLVNRILARIGQGPIVG